jgi:hypothetical protein
MGCRVLRVDACKRAGPGIVLSDGSSRRESEFRARHLAHLADPLNRCAGVPEATAGLT